jgi:hypothetical protein
MAWSNARTTKSVVIRSPKARADDLASEQILDRRDIQGTPSGLPAWEPRIATLHRSARK